MKTVMLAGLVAVLLVPSVAWGAQVWTDPQVLVDLSDYVVLGKIVDVDKAAGQANIQVKDTLKGVAKERIPVRFAPAQGDGMIVTKDGPARWGEGVEGIWILEHPDKDGRYDLGCSLRRMQVEEAGRAKYMVKNFSAIKWCKPVNGLNGAVRVLPAGNQEPVRTFNLYLAVKNVSDKPLTVQQTGAVVGMHFILKNLEGETRINLPVGGRVTEKSVRLEPGQVIYVGFNWPTGLPTGAMKPGDYTVMGTYGYALLSAASPPADLWMGKIETEPLEIKVGSK